jgi:glycosyltransferase involved in cell wall biosynthesis
MTARALFWVHDPGAPSFRHRLAALDPALTEVGIEGEVDVLPRREYGIRVLRRLRRVRDSDLLVVAKLKLEAGERALVRRAARRIVYDFDDAVYYAKPSRPGNDPDRARLRVRKFRRMCALADLVTAGNSTLGAFARPWARRIAVVPTGVDPSAFEPKSDFGGPGNTIVWIGMGENLPYLRLVEEALAALAREMPNLRLRIVSDRAPEPFAAPIELARWSSENEAHLLADSDVGIMPLPDDDWARGKGGFKLLQYMAAGLPTVASPVGVNREIVVAGETGLLASGPGEWVAALRKILTDRELARRMGGAGRRRVEALFDRRAISRRVASLYRELLGGP